jgi:signal peptidase II
MKSAQAFLYLAIAALIFSIDRFTKLFALQHCLCEYRVSDFLSFDLTINRGISWGILNTTDQSLFLLITGTIILITAVLIVHAYRRFKKNYLIYGEIFVITGSLSNIIDRLSYGGVIDFIVCSWHDYIFPTFNIADSAIVIGVMIMFFQLFYEV